MGCSYIYIFANKVQYTYKKIHLDSFFCRLYLSLYAQVVIEIKNNISYK